jgi:hypothetical protein
MILLYGGQNDRSYHSFVLNGQSYSASISDLERRKNIVVRVELPDDQVFNHCRTTARSPWALIGTGLSQISFSHVTLCEQCKWSSKNLRRGKSLHSTGQARQSASSVPMPETAVDENDPAEFPENDVRVSGQILGVEAVSISKSEDKLANEQLGPRVFGPYPCHDLRSLGRRKSIHTPYSPFGTLKSGHLSAMYCSAASRTTQASDTFFSLAMPSSVS